MSDPAPRPANGDRLLVVRVEDQINPTLAGRPGARYDSPPQPREQAHTLVRLLLGWPSEPLDGQTRWRCAVAGGTRTVTLDPVRTTGTVGGHSGDIARAASDRPPIDGR